MPVTMHLNSFHEFYLLSILLASDGELLRAFLLLFGTRAVEKSASKQSRAELS